MKNSNPKFILTCLLMLFLGINLQAQVIQGVKRTGETAADRDSIYVLKTGALTGYPMQKATGELIVAPKLGTLQTDGITANSIKVLVPVITIGCAVPTVTICAYTTADFSGTPICVASPAIVSDTVRGTLTGLLGNVTYYIRVIATNAGGQDTAKGNATTLCPTIPRTTCTVAAINTAVENGQSTTSIDSVKDHEGNWYDVVQIGTQCWLKENMKCKTSPKGLLTQGTTTSYTASYYYNYKDATYTDTTVNIAKWGRLYNWCAAIDTNVQDPTFTLPRRGICPVGWHLPSDAEWTIMEVAAGIGDETALNNTGWRGDSATVLVGGCDWTSSTTGNAPGNYNNARRNATGFSVFPSGFYGGSFYNAGTNAVFWSSTRYGSNNAYRRSLSYSIAEVVRNYSDKGYGFSVRCLRDVLTLGDAVIDNITPTTMDVTVPITATGGATPTATICAYTDAAHTTGAICVMIIRKNPKK